MKPRRIFALAGIVLVGACSEPKNDDPPTRQEVHSRDSGVATGQPGRHRYHCEDGRTLLVDYKDNGLRLDLLEKEGGPSRTLSAPTQELQYVGDGVTATFSGVQLRLVDDAGRVRICVPDGSR
ncbi:hypothetical protein KZ813_16750 [Sphingomonas sp. RHCKR7]|uniref:hypothetical protein n=1 Tax=Sphingomonas folli TaxID=2862497 RepID=UPI001CA59A4B|nr:hypothetical protein [Sphingomonas folli]MBW6528494.1 hypothetical protein [Sphingomonas folli]